MGEPENLQDGCDCKKWFTFDIKFLIYSTWSRCGIYVMKKYRVSTINVPIFIEIRFGDKIRSIIFERSYGLQTSKMAENEDWMRLAKPVHIAQNQFRP